jgi:hypothetical protein
VAIRLIQYGPTHPLFLPSMQLLTNLRKLDCYKLEVGDLISTDVLSVLTTLQQRHPRIEVQVITVAAHELLFRPRSLSPSNFHQHRNHPMKPSIPFFLSFFLQRLSAALLEKWRALLEAHLFRLLPYDVAVAQQAPEGEPEAPEVIIRAEQLERKLERQRRRKEEDNYLDSSSDDEMQSEEEEWDPTAKKN